MVEVYKTYRTKRKTIAIIIDDQGRVTVRAPLRAAQRSIDDFLQLKEQWILQKIAIAKENYKQLPKDRFSNGAVFYALGVSVLLTKNESGIFLGDERIGGKKADVPVAIKKWYKKSAANHFEKRAAALGELYGYKYSKIKVSSAKKRWGSCNVNGNINLSMFLYALPPHLIDYVVIHELCHTKHHNHSSGFWAAVERIYPDYKNAKREINDFSKEHNIWF